MPPPDDQLLVLSPEKLGLLALVAGFLPKLAEWFWERFWKREDQDEVRRQAEMAALRTSMDGLTKEVRAAFDELRGLITRQDLAIAELRIELRHAQERVSRLEVRLDKEAA